MKVELPGESKSFADIEAGECFAFTRKHVSSVCMKVEWLSSASVAVLWSASDDWTVPHLITPTELAGSILHSLPSAVFVASSDAKDVLADRTRHEYAPGFLIKTPTGQPLIAVKGLQREHGIPVIDVEPREQVSARNLVRRIFRGSVKPCSLLAGGQQINVLRRRVQNASFHGAAPVPSRLW